MDITIILLILIGIFAVLSGLRLKRSNNKVNEKMENNISREKNSNKLNMQTINNLSMQYNILNEKIIKNNKRIDKMERDMREYKKQIDENKSNILQLGDFMRQLSEAGG